MQKIVFQTTTLFSISNYYIIFLLLLYHIITACNSVLVRGKYSSEIVQVELIKSYCLPILVYSLGALEMNASLIEELSVCWNNGFRKNFRLHRWESVEQLQFFVVF